MDFKNYQLNFWNNLPDAFSNEKSCELIQKYKETRDKKIRDEIIYGNMRLIANCAHNFFPSFKNSTKFKEFEDVAQEAIFAAINAVDGFDLNKGTAFSTYLQTCVEKRFCVLLRKVKKEEKVLSLNANVFSDDEEVEFQDVIIDKNSRAEVLESQISLQFIKSTVLPILSKKERDIFKDYYFCELTLHELAMKYDVSRQLINELVQDVTEKTIKLYKQGISQTDMIVRGVRVTKTQREKIEKGQAILKKYGRENLEKNFIPKLKPDQAKIFKSFVLNYYGKPVDDVSKKLNIKKRNVSSAIKSVLNKLEKEEENLLKNQRKLDLKEKKPILVQEYCDYANRIVSHYGGKLFLYRYFACVLPEKEKEVFLSAVLDYDGESYLELAKQCGLELDSFTATLAEIKQKLKDFDFKIVVELIDNAETFKTKISPLNKSKINNIKKRKNIAKKFGGVIKLKRHFLPILSELEKIIFKDMYLNPKFDSLQTMSEFYDLTPSIVAQGEKDVIKKLKEANIDQRAQLYDRAHRFANSQSAVLKAKRIKNGEKMDAGIEIFDEHITLSLTRIFDLQNEGLRSAALEAYLKKYGGKLKLIENFLPTLKSLKAQQIFVSSLIEGRLDEEVSREFMLSKEEIKAYRIIISSELISYDLKKNKKNKIK